MQVVNRLSIIHGRVVDAGDKVPSPLRWVRALRVVLNPASGPDLRSTFMRAARKISLDLEQVGKGRPDAYRVAALLGIERHLASKIFFVGIAPKLGPDATGDWFKLLGSKPPESVARGCGGWVRVSLQHKTSRSVRSAARRWGIGMRFVPSAGLPCSSIASAGKRPTGSASDSGHPAQDDD